MEVDNSLASDLTMILRSRLLNVGNAVRVHGLVEDVVVAIIVEVVVEAVANFQQTHAELTLAPSMEL
jgi:hypothetical protein